LRRAGRLRVAPSPRRRRAAEPPPQETLTPLERLRYRVQQLLDTVLDLAVADPDVEGEFARLIQLMFERMKVPPPPVDIGDDVEEMLRQVTRHLQRYRDRLVDASTDVEEEQQLQMIALNALHNAAAITIRWYAPREEAIQLLNISPAPELQARPRRGEEEARRGESHYRSRGRLSPRQ